MGSVEDYYKLMEDERRGTSATFPMFPPELQPSGDDPSRGAGFGEPTQEQIEAEAEKDRIKSNLMGERTIDKAIEAVDRTSLVDPTPLSDIASTGLGLARGVKDDVGAEELSRIGSLGLAAMMVPFISAKQLKVFKRHSGTSAADEARDLLKDYSKRLDAGDITEAQARKELGPKLDILANNAGVEATLDTSEAQVRKRMQKARRSDDQLRSMGGAEQARADIDKYASESTTKRTRGTSPVDQDLYGKASVGEFAGGAGTYAPGGRAPDLGADKRTRGATQDRSQGRPERQSRGPRTRKVGGRQEKVRPGAELELEKLRTAHRSQPASTRGPEPTFEDVPDYWVPKDYKVPEVDAPGSENIQRRLASRRAKDLGRLEEASAKKSAREAAEKRSQKSFNDDEIAFLSSIDDVAERDKARKMLLDARDKGTTVTRNQKGEFIFKSEPRAESMQPKNVKLNRQELLDQKRVQSNVQDYDSWKAQKKSKPAKKPKDLPRLKKK